MASTSKNIHEREDMHTEIECLRAENKEKAMLNKTSRDPIGTYFFSFYNKKTKW